MKVFFIVDPHVSERTPSSRRDNYFESILAKISYVVSQMAPEDVLVFTGDVFDRPHLPDQYLSRFAAVLPPRCFSIIGNHDVKKASMERVSDSSLGVLFATGRMQRLTRQQMGTYILVGVDFDQDPTKMDVAGCVVVCHKAISDDGEKGFFGDDEVWDTTQIRKQKPKLVVAGHDHEETDHIHLQTLDGPGPTIIRIGALSRGTAHQYNKQRTPQCLVLDTESGDVRVLPVNHLGASEIFSEQSSIQVRAEVELQELLHSLRESATRGTEEDSLEKVIAELNIPIPVKKRLVRYLQESGIVLKQLVL